MAKTALITGISGQDGSYLAELLLGKEYRVYGMVRRSPTEYFENIEHIKDRLVLKRADLMDQISLMELIEQSQPDEIYNLASYSFVPLSWDEPVLTAEHNGLGVARLLEAIRRVKPDVHFYQASSSEMFGKPEVCPQNEKTPFCPGTPYGSAKLYAHSIVGNYRDKLGLFSCSGILYNHESPRRGRDFVTRKITLAAARIKAGLQDKLILGSLDAKRDWGYAKDYVYAMWLMLQQPQGDDFVIASGEEHSVRDCVEIAFDQVKLDWRKLVETDPSFVRQVELSRLVGDATKARTKLGWKPSVSFDQLIRLMTDADIAAVKRAQAA